jgi:hypothetical protein
MQALQVISMKVAVQMPPIQRVFVWRKSWLSRQVNDPATQSASDVHASKAITRMYALFNIPTAV